jgi:DNA-binding CsgD family transcriptional regulator
VRDPEARRPVPPAAMLARWFGLSAAEAELAAALMAGASPAAHAAARRVSAETVRTQLKALMGKLGCHRQGELAARLHDQGPPHVGL